MGLYHDLIGRSGRLLNESDDHLSFVNTEFVVFSTSEPLESDEYFDIVADYDLYMCRKFEECWEDYKASEDFGKDIEDEDS